MELFRERDVRHGIAVPKHEGYRAVAPEQDGAVMKARPLKLVLDGMSAVTDCSANMCFLEDGADVCANY